MGKLYLFTSLYQMMHYECGNADVDYCPVKSGRTRTALQTDLDLADPARQKNSQAVTTPTSDESGRFSTVITMSRFCLSRQRKDQSISLLLYGTCSAKAGLHSQTNNTIKSCSILLSSVNQSISRFLQWTKWCNHCKDHYVGR